MFDQKEMSGTQTTTLKKVYIGPMNNNQGSACQICEKWLFLKRAIISYSPILLLQVRPAEVPLLGPQVPAPPVALPRQIQHRHIGAPRGQHENINSQLETLVLSPNYNSAVLPDEGVAEADPEGGAAVTGHTLLWKPQVAGRTV